MKILNNTTFLILFFCVALLAVLATTLFATPTKVFASHSRVDLQTADRFAVLGGSAISDTGTSVIAGDVGLSPTGGASITGLTCAEVTGTIFDTNGGYVGGGGGSTACLQTNAGLLTAAKNHLTDAYLDAGSRTTTAQIATDLASATLTDGTYDSASGTFEITGGGTLTLNGQGNANAVFIFKMATTLVTSSSSRVVLTNGAQACNVYWQVGSSATLGTSTNFIGNILALTSITDDGSSTVNGRLLARNAAVTLNNTTINKATCAAGTTGGPTTPADSATSGSVKPSSPSCPTLNSQIVAPTILQSRRVDADSIFISWGPYSGVNTFTVQYGTVNGQWLYTTSVTGFSTTINALPANQPIWVRVVATDNCSEGIYGESRLVGGPRLPNTGYAPYKNSILWYVPAILFAGISTVIILIQKNHEG